MAQKLKFGNGTWATKEGSTLAYSDTNNAFKPLPFTTTRNSIATRVNKQGLIEVVGNDIPRIDYTDSAEGVLLLEPSRTNLITSKVSDWTAFNSSTTQSNESPDGYNNAVKITSTAIVNSGVYLNGLSVTGNTEIFTIWLKGENGGEILEIGDATNRTTVTLTNEWVRYEAKKTSASSFKILYNQTTNPIIQTWYAWGAQLEDNVSYPTSYIPTSGSTVTRQADTANGSGNSEVFNDSEGVLFLNTASLVDSDTPRAISISDGTISNRIYIYYSTSNGIEVGVKVLGTDQAAFSSTLTDSTLFSKIAIKFKVNDFSLWINGFEVGSDLLGSIFTANTLTELAFDLGNNSNDFYGKTKELGYYDEILTEEELEYLTSYRSLNELVTELNLNTL